MSASRKGLILPLQLSNRKRLRITKYCDFLETAVIVILKYDDQESFMSDIIGRKALKGLCSGE